MSSQLSESAHNPQNPLRVWLDILGLSSAISSVFLLLNYLHFEFLTVAVILYASFWDAVVASILVVSAYYLWRRKAPILSQTELILTVIAANLLILLYAVMGPTVIDRSLSLYIAEKIDYRGGQVAEAAMPDIIRYEYMSEFKVPEVRMTEQVTSGTVKISNGCIHLTDRGRAIAAFTRFYRAHFLPKHRKLGNTVGDVLRRPYQDAPVRVPFACP